MGYDLTIARADAEALFDLRGTPDSVTPLVQDLNLALPARPNSTSQNDDLQLLWVAPERWLVNGPLARESELRQLTERYREQTDVSITLLTDYYAGFDLHGPEVRETLAQATPLNLDPGAFGEGAVTYTEFFGLTGLIRCLGAVRYRVHVERSYADFILARLRRAAGS